MANFTRFLIPLCVLAMITVAGGWPLLAAVHPEWRDSTVVGLLFWALALLAAVYLRHVAALVIGQFNQVVEVLRELGARPIQGDVLRNIAQWSFLGVLREKDWVTCLEYSLRAVWGVAVLMAVLSPVPILEKLAATAGLLAGPAFAVPLAWTDVIWPLPALGLLGLLAALPPCDRVSVRTDAQLVKLMLDVLDRVTQWRMALKNALVSWTDNGLDETIDMLRLLLFTLASKCRKGGGKKE